MRYVFLLPQSLHITLLQQGWATIRLLVAIIIIIGAYLLFKTIILD